MGERTQEEVKMEKNEKTRHTPGPWHYEMDGFQISIGDESTRHDYLKHDRTVAVIRDNSAHAEADARLIAAAPDLLEALEGMIEKPGQAHPGTNCWDRAQAAFAKAKGE